jgi:hypothetical protein
MDPIPELAPHLKQLRLSGILDSLEARNRQARSSRIAGLHMATRSLSISSGEQLKARCRRGCPIKCDSALTAGGYRAFGD